jgi:hypothetical protein
MSGGDGIDLTLEYMLSGARGLQWSRPIIPGSQDATSRSPGAGNAYPLLRAPRHGGRWDSQTSGKILPTHAQR